ncbi:MAG: hypothetical protein RR490_11035 [Niameybacter sp.]
MMEGEGNEVCYTYRGYLCEIRRTPDLGILCGYVHYKGFLPERFVMNIECHGGITYFKPGIVGFDCGHTFDLVPEQFLFMQELKEYNEPRRVYEFKKYRNMEYVKRECESIVEQIIEYKRPMRRLLKWLGLWNFYRCEELRKNKKLAT